MDGGVCGTGKHPGDKDGLSVKGGLSAQHVFSAGRQAVWRRWDLVVCSQLHRPLEVQTCHDTDEFLINSATGHQQP